MSIVRAKEKIREALRLTEDWNHVVIAQSEIDHLRMLLKDALRALDKAEMSPAQTKLAVFDSEQSKLS